MTPEPITIGPEHRAHLRRAIDAALPRECCGVLLGADDSGVVVVRRVLPTLNATTLTGSFVIPGDEIRRVRRLAGQSGEAIIAMFHSHPGGPLDLSNDDRKALVYSEWPWVIVTEADMPGDVEFRHYGRSAG